MRMRLYWISLLLVLVALNGMVWRAERVATTGRMVLLRIVPRDPRSLMQGDYMQIRYALESECATSLPAEAVEGRLVVAVDARGVGTFRRVDRGEPLAADEVLLRYRRHGSLHLGAESFFFQEGQAARYAGARYGELRVARDGTCVLTGLRDEELQPLGEPRR